MLLTALYLRLYSAGAIPGIPRWIVGASRRRFDDHLSRTFESLMDWDGSGLGTLWSVHYNEGISFDSHDNSLAMAACQPPQIGSPFTRYLDFTLCQSWQSGRADPIENTAVASDIPSLILAGQFDPVTPPSWGKLASETLSKSFYFQFPGLSHGIIRSNECGLDIGLQFIDDPAAEPDASCMKELTNSGFESAPARAPVRKG